MTFPKISVQLSTARLDSPCLAIADRIGSRLCRDALWAGDRCNWIGPSMENTGSGWGVVHRALGPDLYAGTAGIGLFLAMLYRVSGLAVHRRYAGASLRQALSRVDSSPLQTEASVYSGRLGIALAVLHAGEAFGEESFIDSAREHMRRVATAPPVPGCIDVIAGSAGAIPVLLRAHERFGDEVMLAGALAHGEHLLSAAEPGPAGCSWNTLPGATTANLTGFAHGTAGISWALQELAAATGEKRFAESAAHAISYEQHYFSSAEDNWMDLRDHSQAQGPTGRPVYGTAWCHGAPGIGRSRLRSWELTGEVSYRQHAEAALRSTRAAVDRFQPDQGFDLTYCHGLAGLGELLLESDPAGATGVRPRLEALFAAAAERFELGGLEWPCGVPGAGESPGLMLGTAGVGLFQLRLATCDTPDVLMIGRGRSQLGRDRTELEPTLVCAGAT